MLTDCFKQLPGYQALHLLFFRLGFLPFRNLKSPDLILFEKNDFFYSTSTCTFYIEDPKTFICRYADFTLAGRKTVPVKVHNDIELYKWLCSSDAKEMYDCEREAHWTLP